jgi:hypothetical protein
MLTTDLAPKIVKSWLMMCSIDCTCGRNKFNSEHHNWIGNSANNGAIHARIRRERGLASEYECVDCRSIADDWSWIHDSDRYNIWNYESRCHDCHVIYGLPLVIKGEDHYLSKLSDDKVRIIRALHKRGDGQLSISKRFGVHPTTIRDVIKHKTWKHVI